MKSYFDTLFAKIYLFKLPFYLGFQSNHYTVEIPNLLEVVPEIFTSMIRYNSLKTPNNISTQSKDDRNKKPEKKTWANPSRGNLLKTTSHITQKQRMKEQ